MAALNDQQKLEELCKKPYKDQTIWFLNACWGQCEKDAELLWKYAHKFAQLDPAGKEGCSLDELNAHRFLEAFGQTETVQEMRAKLRAAGAIDQRVKLVAITHFLLVHYNVDYHKLVNAPQGSKKEVEEAQRRLDEVQKALKAAEERASESRAAEAEAKQRESTAIRREKEAKEAEQIAKKREAEAIEAEAVAKKREQESKARAADLAAKEAELLAAKAALEKALAELKREEDAYNSKTQTLTKQSEEGTVVQRNKAKNELAQHLAQETLPLRSAKINQEAAVRKADKAAQAASDARAPAEAAAAEATKARTEAERTSKQATQARAAAEQAARQATEARAEAQAAARAAEHAAQVAEEALQEAHSKLAEAEAYLEEVKSRIGEGASWWIDRELHEARAYMPQAKGGYAKKKV